MPYTVIDSFAPPVQSSSFSYGSTVFATYNGTTVGQAYQNCGGAGAQLPPVTTCLNPALFAPAGSKTAFGNLGRNAFVGPHFFDTDFSIMKMTKIRIGRLVSSALERSSSICSITRTSTSPSVTLLTVDLAKPYCRLPLRRAYWVRSSAATIHHG